MKYATAKQGRVFVIRLEDGDLVREEIERFAAERCITRAALIIHGGLDQDSPLVTGPRQGRAPVIDPMGHTLSAPHEVTGTGTLFPDEKGRPTLHMHLACGRGDSAMAGCVRQGVKTWHVLEIVFVELLDCTAKRKLDPQVGLGLLEP